MRILLDCGAIKTGGGAQLASTFLEYLEAHPLTGQELTVLVPEIGPLAALGKRRHDLRVLTSPQAYSARLAFEHGSLQRFLRSARIDAIFTFFGAGLPHPASVHSVVSVAYPVICYPDSPYWRNAKFNERVRVRALNWMRMRRLRRATTIIVETPVMKARLLRVLSFPAERIRVIPPAVSTHVRELHREPHAAPRRFALVSGNETHKNLWRLYEIAVRARAAGLVDLVFHLTVPRESFLARLESEKLDPDILDRHFVFLGPIPPDEIMKVYESADCLVSLSDLESFSNNYMEAWKVGLPIVASDRDFARAICGDSALYVEPHDAESVVQGLLKIRADLQLRRRMLSAGRARLRDLPTLQERTTRVFAELDAMKLA